jgi:hypothetical protein
MRPEKGDGNPKKLYGTSDNIREASKPSYAESDLPSKPGHDQGRPNLTANYGAPQKGYEYEEDDGDFSALLVANTPS